DHTANILLENMHLIDDDSVNVLDPLSRLTVGGLSTSRNIYFEYTDIKGCVNTDSVTNIVINPYPAIDFKMDGTITPTFYTCLNESNDVFLDRKFNLIGFYTETGSGIAKQGQRSDFRIFDELGNELNVGILSDLDAVAEFSPKDARKSLSATDPVIQDYAPANTYTITFTHTDANGCTSTVDNDIVVWPKPEFKVLSTGIVIDNKACASQDVDFTVNLNNMLNTDASFIWTIKNTEVPNQNINTINVLADDYGIGGGSVLITVLAKDLATGCEFQVSEPKSIGVLPTPRFRWENITVGSETVFSFEENSLDPLYSEYLDVNLLITDQQGSIVENLVRNRIDYLTNNNDILENDTVVFVNPGVYTASFYLKSTANCDSTVVRDFNIVDRIQVPVEGILHTFDTGSDGWHTDSISVDGFYDGISDVRISDIQSGQSQLRYSTWEWSQPSGRTLNLTNTQGLNVTGNAWITNADGAYGNKGKDGSSSEHSWVYSPAFDISALEKPALSFTYASHMLNTDGVVLQYSLDDGKSWHVLGSYSIEKGNSGINWYNFEGLPGAPGTLDDPTGLTFNPNQFGWTKNTDVIPGMVNAVPLNNDYYWQFAANKIDEKDPVGNYLIPRQSWTNIRFRFALGTRPSIKQDELKRDIEGFAFDNFRIYDRKKVVLFESFASVYAAESLQADSLIEDRIGKAGFGTIWINYFTDLDGTIDRSDDVLFNRNVQDPAARSGFYGISKTPTSVLDGEVVERKPQSTELSDRLLGWNQNSLNKKELVEPEFDVSLSVVPTTEPDQVIVSGTFTSLIDLPDQTELAFRFVVVENYITNLNTGNYTSFDTIRNVLRVMLPNASGFVEKGSVKTGDAFEYSIDWTIDAVYNLDEMRVVAFVQNEITREIYQVGFVDVDGKANTITGVSDGISKGLNFTVYPNPADAQFGVEFEKIKALDVDVSWSIIDLSGRLIQQGIFEKDQQTLTIDTERLSSGVYFLQLTHEKYRWEPKRIMILHD
ncbi:MAG: T9SS type A sorting domain-containing protein, partial [Cyclobacteriaceae bacterium]|nr:T9SS type A sorting domain-containing protein [Cyclobacteriaceae bacterium]